MAKKVIKKVELTSRQELIKKYVKLLTHYESEVAVIKLKLDKLREEEKNGN